MNARPLYNAIEAVARARLRIGHGVYRLGTGNIDTPLDGESDCCGFSSCYAYGIRRHRPGYNVGPHATVSDDVNCNSSIEDAHHAGDLFKVISRPELGALLKYPTIRIRGKDGKIKEFCGHEGIVVGISRALEWDALQPDYRLLDVVQCCGPNGHTPGIIASNGAAWHAHDQLWSKPEHRTWMLRVES